MYERQKEQEEDDDDDDDDDGDEKYKKKKEKKVSPSSSSSYTSSLDQVFHEQVPLEPHRIGSTSCQLNSLFKNYLDLSTDSL